MERRFSIGKVVLLVAFNLLVITLLASNARFQHINSKYGISMREVYSICEDHNGFIWASSKTGILRISENDYRIYKLPYEDASVTVRMVYNDSTFVVYTSNGQIFLFNEVLDRFELLVNIRTEYNSSFMSINSILIGTDKTLWIATDRGLYRHKDGNVYQLNNNRGHINNLTWFSDREIILNNDNKLYKIDVRTSVTTLVDIAIEPSGFRISNLFMDSAKNVLWIGTMANGLYSYDFAEKKTEKFPITCFPKQPITSFEFNYDSTLFIGIDGQGIWQLDTEKAQVLNIYKENIDDPGSIKGNGVYDIYLDDDNRVWVCTYSDGLSYFDQLSPLVQHVTHEVNNPNSLPNNNINSVIQDKNGKLWIATNNGISCWDMESNNWRNFYTNKQEQAQVFLTLCEDEKGRIWAGTYASGVYVIDGETGAELQHYSSKEPASPIHPDYAFDIYEDAAGDIWIGGINIEVARYIISENRFQKYNTQPLYVFAGYGEQMLLGCAYGLGITDKYFDNSRILVNGFVVQDILVKDSLFWICTNGDGLIKFNPSTRGIVQYTTSNGLPSNFVNSIAPMDDYFWLGTESGICRFSYKDTSVLTYPSIHSISNLSFNQNAVCQLRNGHLAWGSNNGIVIFNPNNIRETKQQGKIFIQNLSISGRSVRDIPAFGLTKPVDKLKSIKLKHNQNTITLELLSIGVAPGSKFSWKMEGLDQKWSQPSNNRVITFSNLMSSDFVLYIKLYDSSLSHIIDKRYLAISVTPPFWSTWYFFVIVFIVITAVFYFIFWYYINLLKQQHAEEKVRFFTNTAHDMRTSLTLIKAPVEELDKEQRLTQNGRYYLKLAREQVDRLSSVVTQLMDFQKVDMGRGQLVFREANLVSLIKNRVLMFESLASGKGVELIFNSEKKTLQTPVDEVKIEKIVDNLVSNAIKYSPAGTRVRVNLKFSEKKWYMEVADQGIGISKKEQKQLFKEFHRGENAINSKIVGSGIGLLLVRNYVTLMGGKIHINSSENKGSTFVVSFPFRSQQPHIGEKRMDPSTHPELSSGKDVPVPDKNNFHKRLGSMNVLVVEDNEELLKFIEHALTGDIKVKTARDGATGWEKIQKENPDLVISDIMMPKMDGFELCRLMKSTFETSHIPIILLSALSEKTDQLHGLGLGADDYLTKPFDISLLKQKITTIIQNRDAIREKALRLIKGSPNNESIIINKHNDQFLKRMLEVIHANISNPSFSKTEFASSMNVSTSLLYVKVKSLTDQSPSDFIRTVRLDHAWELLHSKNYSVTEVSELSGFSNPGYFCTVFKKHFGKTPSEV
ncbi:MAG: response regulator [Prolixibacteraceae bacterium]|nr:response regulator [Prolixibacteraceae bacterium]